MDFQSTQSQIPVVPVRSPSNFFNKTLLICITLLFVGFILGIITWAILPFGKTDVTLPPSRTVSKIDESNLPISLSLLTNPIVYEWRGSIKGKMTVKDEHTFALIDDKGNSITITDLPPNGGVFKTIFLNKSDKPSRPLSLRDIPLGSVLRGEFFVFKDGPNTPVGSLFIKE